MQTMQETELYDFLKEINENKISLTAFMLTPIVIAISSPNNNKFNFFDIKNVSNNTITINGNKI